MQLMKKRNVMIATRLSKKKNNIKNPDDKCLGFLFEKLLIIHF